MNNAINFTPFPDLTTKRLSLRRMSLEDCNEIFFLRTDESVLRYTGITKAETMDDVRKYIEKVNDGIDRNEAVMWALCLINTSRLLGTICLWNFSPDRSTAEIGYVLHPDFQGMGLMHEAVVKVIDYGFRILQLTSIDADVVPNNSRSIKLSERNGFILTSESPDMLIYSLKNNTLSEKN